MMRSWVWNSYMGLVSFERLRDLGIFSFSQVRAQRESTTPQPEREHLQKTSSARDLVSDVPASSTVSLCWIDHPDLVHCYNSLVINGVEEKEQWFCHLGGPPLILFPSWGRQLISMHTGKTSKFLWLPIHLKYVISSALLRDSAET